MAQLPKIEICKSADTELNSGQGSMLGNYVSKQCSIVNGGKALKEGEEVENEE